MLIPAGTTASCEAVDDLPPKVRALIHEFGFAVVQAFVNAGIHNPKVIRRLIYAVWLGPRELANVPSHHRNHIPTLATLDLALTTGRIPNAAALVQYLRGISTTIVPWEPSGGMVRASIEETGRLGLVSKEEKHRARLRAAIRFHGQRLLDGTADRLSVACHSSPP